ncbi:hypothetical protein MMC22_000489 [Lobaria immixta]|nr:hypothetical protein [Lobaria immixta]
MSEVVAVCERELVLYQNPEIIRLVEQCYVELLQLLEKCHRAIPKLKSPTAELFGRQITFRTSMEKSMTQIGKLFQSVIREVDYRHRLEMRDASHRLVEMQTEQRKILLAVEDQKRVLQALQEERSIMSLVQEQQKIMQVVQNIQRRMQNSTLQDAGSRVDV